MDIRNIYFFKNRDISQYPGRPMRNNNYVKLLSEIYDLNYVCRLDRPTTLDSSSFLFFGNEITFELLDRFGSPGQIWGGATKFDFPLKGISHPQIDVDIKRTHFPTEFARSLSENEISTFGYTCFTRPAIFEAYSEIVSDGYRARFKDTLGAGTKGQKRIYSISHLENILKDPRYSDEYIMKYGVMIEVNVLQKSGSIPPEAYSAGILNIMGEKYWYLGNMHIGDAGPFGYKGTSMTMSNKGFKDVLSVAPQFSHISKKVQLLEKLVRNEESLNVGVRLNMDLMAGVYERIDGSYSSEGEVFVNETTFHPGDATGAELLAIKYLRENPNVSTVTSHTLSEYGANGICDPHKGQIVFSDVVDYRQGRIRVSSILEKDLNP